MTSTRWTLLQLNAYEAEGADHSVVIAAVGGAAGPAERSSSGDCEALLLAGNSFL
jgi:hypothetical protein